MEKNADKLIHPDYYPAVMVAGIHSLFEHLLCQFINNSTGYRALFLKNEGGKYSDHLAFVKSTEKLSAVFISYEIEYCHGPELARSIKQYQPGISIIGFSLKYSETKLMRMLDA